MGDFFFALNSAEVESIAQTTPESHDGLMWQGPIQYLKCGAIAFICGCAPASPSEAPQGGVESSNDASEHAGSNQPSSSRGATGSESSESDHPLSDEREPDPEAALPRLTYKHLGMHIGGESNSRESKRPWLDDIERHEEAMLSCYRFVTDPRKGGSYGVDLFVSTKGGSPEVRGSRQKLGGEEFDACMRRAFLEIDFHRPERPTVFSYSIFFELEE